MPDTPAMGQPAMDQQSFMRIVAQICAEGWDRMAAGQNRTGDEKEEEEEGWTGLQVAMTSVAVMMGAKALDLGGCAHYRKLVAFERTLDHEQKGT